MTGPQFSGTCIVSSDDAGFTPSSIWHEVVVKDDHNEVAMCGRKQKPSIWSIAGIFAAAVVLVLLLLWTPSSGILSETRARPPSTSADVR
jgi:hypothetical protein